MIKSRSMAGDKPNIYDIDFGVYDVNFKVFSDTERAAAAIPSIEMRESDCGVVRDMGALAISEDSPNDTLISAPDTEKEDAITEDGLMQSTVAAPIPVEEDPKEIDDQELEVASIEIPPLIQEAVTSAIDEILASTDKAFIAYQQIIQLSHSSDKLPKGTKKYYDAAIRQDGRVEQFRDDSYMVVAKSDEVMQAYIEGKDPLVLPERIEGLIELLIQCARPGIDGNIRHGGILGALKAQGEFLTSHEQHAFWVKVYEDERIVPLKSGSFFIHQSEAQTQSQQEVEPLEEEDDSRPLTRSELNRAIKEAEQSEEKIYAYRRERQRGRRISKGANTPHHSTKSMGRTHGKKKSIDQLIAEMNGGSSRT